MSYGYIYKITNILNNKIYIGKTKNSIERRFNQHKKSSLTYDSSNSISYLHSAMYKYGVDNFIIEEIDTADSLTELNQKEKYWINEFNSIDKSIGYNLAKGGDGGDIFNQLDKEAQNKKREKHSIDTSNRIWVTNGIDTKYIKKDDVIPEGYYRGRTFNTSNIGKYERTEEHRQAMKGRNPSMLGKHLSEETKQKLREANLGKKYSAEVNKKKGRPKYGKNKPMYGRHYMWLTNNIEEIKLFENDWGLLDNYYSNGYHRGRINHNKGD